MHFDLDDAVTLTGLASSAFDVERKTPRFVTARLGFRQAREPVTDRTERSSIGRGVRPRGPANRTLVNIDDLVQLLQPFDRFTRAGRLLGPVQTHGCGFEQCLNRQRGLAATGYTRDANEFAQWEIDAHVFQVVARRFDNAHGLTVSCSPLYRNRNLARSRQILAGDRVLVIRDLFRCTVADDLAAVDTGTRTNIEHIIRLANGVFVMFYHDHRVSLIPQVFQRRQKAIIVALVQTN